MQGASAFCTVVLCLKFVVDCSFKGIIRHKQVLEKPKVKLKPRFSSIGQNRIETDRKSRNRTP